MASMSEPVIERLLVNRKLLNEHKVDVPAHSVYAYCWALTIDGKRSYFSTEEEAKAALTPTEQTAPNQEAEAGS